MIPMLRSFRPLAAAFLIAGAALPATASAADSFSDAQKTEIETVVRDYLIKHPEVVLQAMQELQARQEKEEKAQQQAALKDNRRALLSNPDDPVMGNPKGDVTVVEFFDYQCGYCKRVFPSLMDTIKADGKVRVVMKELPVLGPASIVAARHALAAKMQGQAKYDAFHNTLMAARGPVTEDSIMSAARTAGLDTTRLATDAKRPEIEQQLRANMELASALGISGTPAFVIGDTLIPGAVEAPVLKKAIDEARKG